MPSYPQDVDVFHNAADNRRKPGDDRGVVARPVARALERGPYGRRGMSALERLQRSGSPRADEPDDR